MYFSQGNPTHKMVDTQHFCLRWNNYQSSITSAFENLRDDEDFVDVTLACDGRSLKAHRVVLSACSPYFRELLKSTPCKHPVIVLQDVAFTDLHALVEFIYHGEVNVHQRSLSSFLKTAEVLRVSGLTQQQAEETNNLAHVQNLANSGGRPPMNHHHPGYSDRIVDDSLLFPQGVSPPPHMNNLHTPTAHPGSTVNQLLRRVAAASALRRERNNSNQSDELSVKRHRTDNGILGNSINNSSNNGSNNLSNSNNNSPDVVNQMPQITATDFSTNLKQHNNNNNNSLLNNNNSNSLINNNNNITPPIKDIDRHNDNEFNLKGSSLGGNNSGAVGGTNNNATGNNGNGSTATGGDKENNNNNNSGSLATSPRISGEDVKSEPMELVCGNNNNNSGGGGVGGGNNNGSNNNNSLTPHDDHSNDSANENDINHSGSVADIKGHLSSPNEEDMDNSIHSHPPFLTPGTFNFSMAALAADPSLAGFNSSALHSAELAASPQGGLLSSNPSHSNNNAAGLGPGGGVGVGGLSVITGAGGNGGGIGSIKGSTAPSISSSSSSSTSSSSIHHQHLHHNSSTTNSSSVHNMTSGGNARLSLPLPLSACHRCDVCGKLLSTKLTLKRHKEQQHLQPLNNAVCNLCHKVFRTLNSLNNHKSIYHRRQKHHGSGNGGNGGGGVGSGGGSGTPSNTSPHHHLHHHHHQQQLHQQLQQSQMALNALTASAAAAAAVAGHDSVGRMSAPGGISIGKTEYL